MPDPRDAARLLVGTLVERASTIDLLLNDIISCYFGLESDRRVQLEDWVLADLTMREKIDLLGRVLDAEPGPPGSASLVGELRRVLDDRNLLAHGTIVAGEGQVGLEVRHSPADEGARGAHQRRRPRPHPRNLIARCRT